MQIVADLHLHSKYSRAVSQDMILPIMAEWAKKKGINLLATGDWTHPMWLKELEMQLEEDGEGIYKIKADTSGVKFVLSCEIANMYTQAGRQRRIHTLFLAPSLAVVRRINDELIKKGGNLVSDGRPILGLSLPAMCEIVWGVDERVLVVPCHAWTPWFSIFGSKSGFDSVEECFGEYEDRIFSVETGLSSDPAMNWRIPDLEKRSIVSFSDAHSPKKMGREATVLELKGDRITFDDLIAALKQDRAGRCRISYTIEFHPEEGKYHYTGHRSCKVVQSPEETRAKGTTCHVCGKQLTVGVMHRVDQLALLRQSADQGKLEAVKRVNENEVAGYFHPTDKTRPPYVMLVPLHEILAEALGVGNIYSVKVNEVYEKMVAELGNELEILLKTGTEKIKALVGERVAEAVEKVRKGEIAVNPGYDGVFGVVKIWGSPKANNDDKLVSEQPSLF